MRERERKREEKRGGDERRGEERSHDLYTPGTHAHIVSSSCEFPKGDYGNVIFNNLFFSQSQR